MSRFRGKFLVMKSLFICLFQVRRLCLLRSPTSWMAAKSPWETLIYSKSLGLAVSCSFLEIYRHTRLFCLRIPSNGLCFIWLVEYTGVCQFFQAMGQKKKCGREDDFKRCGKISSEFEMISAIVDAVFSLNLFRKRALFHFKSPRFTIIKCILCPGEKICYHQLLPN